MAEKKIRAIIVVEMLGRPLEHLTKTFSEYFEKMKEESFMKVLSQKIFEPKKLEQSETLYTCFGEVEFEVSGFVNLTDVIFKYMPASVEIIEPNYVEMNSVDVNDLLNSVSGRLHRYDEIAKGAQIQIGRLAKRLQEVLQEKVIRESAESENIDIEQKQQEPAAKEEIKKPEEEKVEKKKKKSKP